VASPGKMLRDRLLKQFRQAGNLSAGQTRFKLV
jgi:hypothetical protein